MSIRADVAFVEVLGIGRDVKIRVHRQPARDVPIAFRRYAVTAAFGPPELHRHADISKALRGEKDSERVGDNGSL
jgi:hypothetical protein